MASDLYECHGHIIADGADYRASMARHERAPDEQYIRSALTAVRDAGVVYYRDGGDKYGVSVLAKTLAPEYGIEYRTSAFIIHRDGYYGAMYGKAYRDLGEYAALVTEAASLGADFIKITVSGMLDFEGASAQGGGVMGGALAEDEIRALVDIAHNAGFLVMAHVNGAENIKNAVRAGVTSIEHGFWADEEAVRLMRDTDTVWVPTAVTVANNIDGSRYPAATMRKIIEHHAAMLRYADDIGITIACGSDCGAYNVLQGRGTLDERAFLSALGIDTAAGDERIRAEFVRG